VAGFHAVEHRLEPVAEIGGVLFVDDSQGTQPDAVIAALRSFVPPIVLIAGGRDKGVPLDALAREAAARAAAVVLIGESAPLLAAALERAGHAHVERAATLEAAVLRAADLARDMMTAHGAGQATVLLSPAAASFDMFVDYAARGRAFKAAVAELAARSARGSRSGARGEGTR
jgi:UDP-N-acetylmuramoylalanine--D-glutamate ligase